MLFGIFRGGAGRLGTRFPETLNQRVAGSSPAAPTNLFKGLDTRSSPKRTPQASHGDGSGDGSGIAPRLPAQDILRKAPGGIAFLGYIRI